MNAKSSITQLTHDIDRYLSLIKTSLGSKQNSKSVNSLKTLWDNYCLKLKRSLYTEKVLWMGDYLFSQKCYKLSGYYCYGHFLQTLFNFTFDDIASMNGERFMSLFVTGNTDLINTLRCLMGYAASIIYHHISLDESLQNQKTISIVVNFLKVLQLSMQVALMEDAHCWLVYNGTIHIHCISKLLMSKGFTSSVLEFLIWSCVSMECSVPLMTVKYLGWRTQLYATTSLCFYDLKADQAAEEFAKRGMKKVLELQEIEKISTSPVTPETKFVFKQSRIKMDALIFKRHIFESRRRPKGVLRPKIKPLLKDIAGNNWPRTGTERMLADIFTGRAAQFLAITETLSNSNRRIGQTSPGCSETDETATDVFMELFFAGTEIVSGGGGTRTHISAKHEKSVQNVTKDMTLIDLATAESQTISLKSVLQFIKYAYNYEQWDTFDTLLPPVLDELKKHPDDELCIAEIKVLKIFAGMTSINSSRLRKKFVMLKTEDLGEMSLSRNYKAAHIEELLNTALSLKDVLEQKNLKFYVERYHDFFVDVILLLWNKCKTYFAKVTSDSCDAHKSLYHSFFFTKWLQIFLITHDALMKFNMADADPNIVAESTLKLSHVLLCIAKMRELKIDRPVSPVESFERSNQELDTVKSPINIPTPKTEESKRGSFSEELFEDVTSFLYIPNHTSKLLAYVLDLLTQCLEQLDNARDKMTHLETKIADDSFEDKQAENGEETINISMLKLKSFQMELLYLHHQVSLQLPQQTLVPSNVKGTIPEKRSKEKSSKIQNSTTVQAIPTDAGKNSLSKALYRMALLKVAKCSMSVQETSKVIQEAFDLLEKARASEERIKREGESVSTTSLSGTKTSIPPPPQVVRRGHTTITYRPAPFEPSNGDVIASYCLFVRNAAGHNVKVRVSDTNFPGTGEKVPFGKDLTLTVTKLVPNERYMAAIAAYNAEGDLIGSSIGMSGRPVLASNHLPLLLAYGYLARIAYLKDGYKVTKQCINILWNYFVQEQPEPKKYFQTVANDFKLKPKRLRLKNIEYSSEVVHRYFVESIFIGIEIDIKEGKLFYDSVSNGSSTRDNQIERLEKCERLLIALEMSGWLNDNQICLQSIVQIYGLLSPIIYWKFPIQPVLEVLCHVFGGLQEIQSSFKNRKQNATNDSLHHMVSCLTYHIATILVDYNRKSVALHVLDTGGKILGQLNPPDSATPQPTEKGEAFMKKLQKRTYKKQKTKGGANKISTDPTNGGVTCEQRAIDIFTSKLLKEGASEGELELTGAEDGVLLNAVVAALPPLTAYKEVLKFKRRAHFLESFVGVIGKALKDRMFDSALDWTKEAVTWLTRRNEIILNKSMTEAGRGILVVTAQTAEGERNNRKLSSLTGLQNHIPPEAEGEISPNNSLFLMADGMADNQRFGRIDERTSNRQLAEIIASQSLDERVSSRKISITKGMSGSKIIGTKKIQVMTAEERIIKDAILRMQAVLPELWKTQQRKKKLRIVSQEELPWRSQMCLISAECHFNICLDKFYLMSRRLGYPNLKFDERMMDFSWFTLSTTGVLMVSWVGCFKDQVQLHDKPVDRGGKTLEHEKNSKQTAEIYLMPSSSRQSVAVKVEKKLTPRPPRVLDQQEALKIKQDDARKLFILNLEQSYNYYQRAMVLAHRGQNWVLLQHICNKLIQSTTTMMMTITLLNNNIDLTKHETPYTVIQLRPLIYNVFYMAAEFLLDFLNNLKLEQDSNISLNNDFPSSLQQSSELPDHHDVENISHVDYGNIKRVVMFAVEVLYYQEKWERLSSLIVKFNAITSDRFCTSLLPILVYAQQALHNRVQASTKPVPRITFDPNTGFPVQIEMERVTPDPIEIGAHIDPEGSDLYNVPDDGLQYSIAPFNFDVSLERFRNAFDQKLYTVKQLEHARLLLVSYLAAKQGDAQNMGKVTSEESKVSFAASQIKPPSYDPEDLHLKTFQNREDLEFYPLIESEQVASIVMSYERAVEMLTKTKQFDLAIQAMHELGNVMYHSNNIRSAYKWWCQALDNILQTTDALNNWKQFVNIEDRTILSTKRLLDICGAKGCLLGGLITTSIAKYIHPTNIDVSTEICHLAASFFQALFCTSLVHPSAFHSYITYDISTEETVKQVIPGLHFFSDMHHLHCGNLTSHLIWLTTRLIRNGFYLRCQPLLTLSHYMASTICKDINTTIEVKLLRIKSLSALERFEEAFHHFYHVVSGKMLPSPADFIRAKVNTKHFVFKNTKLITDQLNVHCLHQVCGININQSPYTNIYGRELCNKISIAQSGLLASVAELLNEIPIEASPSVSKESSTSSSTPNSNSKEKMMNKERGSPPSKKSDRKMQAKKSKENIQLIDVKQHSLNNLKWKLLNSAENAVRDILKLIVVPKNGEAKMRSEELEAYIGSQLQLSQIESARYHVLASANHIHECLIAINYHTTVDSNQEISNTYEYQAKPNESFDKGDTSIDCLTWLKCRRMLSSRLSDEDNAVGRLAGPMLSLVGRVGSFEEYVQNALVECKIFNDTSSACLLKMLQIQSDLKCGKDTYDIIERLKELQEVLSSYWILPSSLVTLEIEVKVLLTDICVLLNPSNLPMAVECYEDIESYFLNQLVLQGYNCHTSKKMPVPSQINFHSLLLSDFTSIKMRLYRAKSLGMVHASQPVHARVWKEMIKDVDSINVLIDRLTNKDFAVKTELTLLKAEIQRFLYELDEIPMTTALDSFLEIIDVVRNTTIDLSIIRRCYNEMTLVFSQYLKLRQKPMTPDTEDRRRSNTKGGALRPNAPNIKRQQSHPKDCHRLSRGAWVCIRAAGVIAKAQRKSELLAGELSVTSLAMEQTAWQNLPSFAVEDLIGVENADQLKEESNCIVKLNGGNNVEITWVHLIKYLIHLRRHCSYSSLALGDFDKAIVRISFHSAARTIKLNVVAKYLAEHLTVFDKECIPIFPIDLIGGLVASVTADMATVKKSASDISQPVSPIKSPSDDFMEEREEDEEEEEMEDYPDQQSIDSTANRILASEKVGDRVDTVKVRNPLQAGDLEIAIQWYKPELSSNLDNGSIFLLLAMNNKTIAGNSSSNSFSQVSSLFHIVFRLEDCIALHDEMVDLIQNSEGADHAIKAGQAMRKVTVGAIATSQAVSKMQSAISSVQKKSSKSIPPSRQSTKFVDSDEDLKSKMIPIVQNISELLKRNTISSSPSTVSSLNVMEEKIPAMEMSWSNLLCLESMFNPSLGHISRVPETFFAWFIEHFNRLARV
ncbi:cilia- and flagella-associated protein 54-like isoform X2 [Clytia hemisphaerica]|uniref:Cilia- and flagella-associated protein 54 n=1 Tax=Clytia hemisphaerica TaxID=252671 RepID=A0A7M5X9B8_9CNID